MASEPITLPPVFFNHLYLVLDDKTYHAVQGSDFLRIAFPGTERRATLTAAGETWNGTYFYCQDNYLEFFGSGSGPVAGLAMPGGHWQPGAQEGWAGLAFSCDQRGGADTVRQKLHAMYGYEPFSELRQLQTRDRPVNWFYSVKLAERLGLGSFESWLMEYHPDIFAYKGLPLPASGNLTREDYLSPWNKPRALPDAPAPVDRRSPRPKPASNRPEGGEIPGALAAPVFSHITGATIHMDSQRAERYAEILAALGYTRAWDGETISLSAHGFTLSIQPEAGAPEGYRLSSLHLTMARPSVAPMTFVFAPRSKLVLNQDLTAQWFFGEQA